MASDLFILPLISGPGSVTQAYARNNRSPSGHSIFSRLSVVGKEVIEEIDTSLDVHFLPKASTTNFRFSSKVSSP